MKKHIHKYLSVLVLLGFLFPMVQKGLHDLEHAGDVHCAVGGEKHFHAQEHVCYLCDHTVPVSSALVQYNIECDFSFLPFYYSGFNSQHYFNDAVCLLPQRGPPFSV